MSEFQKILNFWFGEPGSLEYGKSRPEWFTKDPAFDEQIRVQFLNDYEQAAAGELKDWQQLPESCLALILLLDQVPRNLFRGSPQAFATDPQALAATKFAVSHQLDRELLPVQRWFMYLPFEHSENLEDQHQSVALFQQFRDDPDCASSVDYAIQHLAIIERFGRFPHRNQILGRETTPEEAEFLKQPGSSF